MLAEIFDEHKKLETDDNIDISDSDDDDSRREDSIKPSKKLILCKIKGIAKKGWDTCSKGFDSVSSKQSYVQRAKSLSKHRNSGISCDFNTSINSEKADSLEKQDSKKSNEYASKNTRRASLLFEIQNIRSVFAASQQISPRTRFLNNEKCCEQKNVVKTPQSVDLSQNQVSNFSSNFFRSNNHTETSGSKNTLENTLYLYKNASYDNSVLADANKQLFNSTSVLKRDLNFSNCDRKSDVTDTVLCKNNAVCGENILDESSSDSIIESSCKVFDQEVLSTQRSASSESPLISSQTSDPTNSNLSNISNASSSNWEQNSVKNFTYHAEASRLEQAIQSKNAPTVKKGSKWLQTVVWQRDGQMKNTDVPVDDDTSKRSQKFEPGGLAEQAQKLKNKERSARVIWNHKRSRELDNSKCSENSIVLTVSSISFMNEIVFAVCSVLRQKYELPENILQNLNDTKQESENAERYLVLIQLDMCNKFKVRKGSIIQIFPPWQELNVPSLPYSVLLGTYFMEILEASYETADKEDIYKIEQTIFTNTASIQGMKKPLLYTSRNSKQIEPLEHPSDSKIHKKKRKKTCIVKHSADDGKHASTSESAVHCQGNMKYSESTLPVPSTNDSQLKIVDSSELYAVCGTVFTLSARIQRIWKWSSEYSKVADKLLNHKSISDNTNTRVSFLLQDKHFRFWELQLSNSSDIDHAEDLISNGEGKCFKFNRVKIIQKLHFSKHPYLFAVMKNIYGKLQKDKGVDSKWQPFCYQLTIESVQDHTMCIFDDYYPPYCLYEVQPLENLISSKTKCFTCVVKVVYEYGGMFYVTDESLLHNFDCNYVKLIFGPLTLKPPMLNFGCIILICDATLQKDVIVINKYSKTTVLNMPLKKENSFTKYPLNSLVLSMKISKLSSLTTKDFFWRNLSLSSSTEDIVQVKGKICNIDDETAISWLECNHCHKENLLQHADGAIFCDDCKLITEHPVLNMKMDVFITVAYLNNMSVRVQLLCSTIKKLLKINDDVIQPKCNIEDVLQKEIGPILCYIRSRESARNQLIFHLVEICSL